jgi:Flp pilus assembly protein TadG
VGVMRRTQRKGNALIEFSLLVPWILFMFTGVFDFGFYCYACVCVQNAARTAATHAATNSTTASDNSKSCQLTIAELRGLPNVGQSLTACSATPLTVTTNYCDGTTNCGSSVSADNGPAAYVAVTYQVPPLFHWPLPGVTSITRTAEFRLKDPLQ